ncbi:MAG: hypothetical protein ACK53I_06905 [Phenylobacterium sp.]|jgi:hypothetical protein
MIARAALALVLTAALAAPAAAEPRGVAAAFGNTVKALYPDGGYQWLWLRANGEWEAFGRRGKWTSGRWTQKDAGKVCLRQSRPIPIPLSYCTDFPANGGVGAVWASRSLEGDPIRVTVVKGIQRP